MGAFLLLVVQILIVCVVIFGFLAIGVWGLSRALGALAKQATESFAQVVREVGSVSSTVAGEVAERVSASVAAGVAESLRGPVFVDDGEPRGEEQLEVTVPWGAWGEDGENESEGDVRYGPDPTDELWPDPTPMDNRERAVTVPPGWDPIAEAREGNGPRVGDLGGEHFDIGERTRWR